MIFAPARLIARREVRDMVNDWRIMVPIFLLSFILPLMLVMASMRVIRFVEDPNLAERLVPFALLLVGFIPASFSLITALESFVGERERNSLEALLAMPISDNELYLGKLFSSLMAPLLSSYVAMIIFSFFIYLFNPSLYFGVITTPRLFLLFVIIGVMALTMVAGAVVISSHISSIRAANLMASFIFLPMAVVVQFEAFLIMNDRWNMLWILALGLFVLAAILVRVGMISFNREEILSREHQHEAERKFLGFLSRFERKRADEPKLATSKAKSPIQIIALRELHETISDWRMLVPASVLTFVIPLVLVAGTDFAIDFLENRILVARILPFVVLLVGFIPASFSLIVALDSFVGERERNSLESLLAMPISDSQLYLSKLISSSYPPITTSFFAMFVFCISMAIFHHDLYYSIMTTGVLVQLLIMICIIVVLMVAGAVIISSHTSSIRAANLLASFVLLPMAIAIQLQALLIIAYRWDVIWYVIAGMVVIAISLIRTGMRTFNREEILSREHEQLNLQVIMTNIGLFLREYQPAGVAPEYYEGKPFSISRFYRHELPALLRDLRLPIIVALMAVVSGLWIGVSLAHQVPTEALDGAFSNFGATPPSSLLLAAFIFFKNIRVSILSNVFSSFSFGLFAFLVPMVAFTQIGFIVEQLAMRGGEWMGLGVSSPLQFLLAYVIPHGIIELPTFILSAALGIRLGAALHAPPEGFTVAQNILWSFATFTKVWLFVILPLVALAAAVEGLLSPLVIQAFY
jgi:ABC-type Na+ efflux pump permease subunit